MRMRLCAREPADIVAAFKAVRAADWARRMAAEAEEDGRAQERESEAAPQLIVVFQGDKGTPWRELEMHAARVTRAEGNDARLELTLDRGVRDAYVPSSALTLIMETDERDGALKWAWADVGGNVVPCERDGSRFTGELCARVRLGGPHGEEYRIFATCENPAIYAGSGSGAAP